LKAFFRRRLGGSGVTRRFPQQSLGAQQPPPASWVRVELASETDPVSFAAFNGVALVVASERRIEPVRNFTATLRLPTTRGSRLRAREPWRQRLAERGW
jgi:hypothetical protein